MIGWHHPIDESDQWDGFNESGIEHFSGNPIRHLAREVVQNSLDSHDESAGQSIKVKFEEIVVPTEEIPGINELRKTFKLCLQGAEHESQKAKNFFEKGIEQLENSQIKVLSISDFNTQGIKGPVKNGTPYYAFMKAKGQSKKQTDTAGGSFGIGKFAPYAVSELRTVFVSTIFKSLEESIVQYTQGKSILMSHDDEVGNRRQGIGFWGVKDKCQPVEGGQELPQWLIRSEIIGTKLLLLGFDDHEGWEESLAASVAENFFGAIKSGRLEVLISDKYNITANSISDIFSNNDICNSIMNEKNEPEQFKNSFEYYNCLNSHENIFFEQHQNQYLGHCELKILLKEGLPKKVSFLRNGMLITDNLEVPGLRNFSEFKDFVAVFNCKNNNGVEILRAMEPPRHDTFEPERMPTKEEQIKARKALKEIAAWIREMLRRRAKDPVSEITRIDELKDFFPDVSGAGSGNPMEETNPGGIVMIKAKALPPKKPSAKSNANGDAVTGNNSEGRGGGGSDGVGGGNGNDGYGKHDVGGGGSGGSGTPKLLAPINNPRAVITGPGTRKISFTALKDAKYEISLFEAGADSDYPVDIKMTSVGIVKDGKIIINAEKDTRISLETELCNTFEGALKIMSYEI
jgi:hypothetical protein